MSTGAIIFLVIWLVTLSLLVAILIQRKMKPKTRKQFSTEFNQMALSVGLNKGDIKEIKALLSHAGITKPYLIFSDPKLLDSIINENVGHIDKLHLPPDEKQKRILFLFEIKRKIYNHFISIREGLGSTLEIEPNQLLSLTITGVGKFYSVVIINDRKNLVINIPEVKDPLSIPWKDKNVEVYFWRYNDAGYVFKTHIDNVIINEKMQALLLSHTDSVKRIQRREYPRRKCRFDCKFFKFSLSTNEDGKPILLLGKTRYGVIIDVSPSGASIVSDSSLVKNNLVKVEFDIEEEGVIAYGKVINSVKKKNVYIIHIQFQRISDKSKNTIYKFVYKYI